MSKLKKAYDIFFRIVEYASAVFLMGMVVICAANVFMRYVMHAALRWGDEMSLFCMIWFSMLSAAVTLKENRHIRVGIWDSILKGKAGKILNVLFYIIIFVVLVILLRYSIKLTQLTGKTKMTGSGIKLMYEYIALPISSFIMLIAACGRVGEIFGWK